MTDPLIAHVDREYAIRWMGPEDIAKSFTMYGAGLGSLARAAHTLRLAQSLPGEMRGELVTRTITYSEWQGAA